MRYPCVIFFIPCLLGIFIHNAWGGHPWLWLVVSGLCASSLANIQHRYYTLFAAAGILCLTGASCAVEQAENSRSIQGLSQGVFKAEASIIRPLTPNTRHHRSLVRLTEIDGKTLTLQPAALCYSKDPFPNGSTGFKATVRLSPIKQTDPFRSYYRKKGVFYCAYITSVNTWTQNISIVQSIRAKSSLCLRTDASECRDLTSCLITGNRQYADKNLYDLLKDTNTAHILAVSGLHVGIIAALAMVIARLLGAAGLKRAFRRAFTAVCVIFYVLYTGPSLSVLRAFGMYLFWGTAFYSGRGSSSVNSLAACGLATCLLAPHTLSTIGFQLSYAVVFGILTFGSALTRCALRWIKKTGNWKKTPLILQVLAVDAVISVTAWLFSAPVILYYFGRISPVSILVNIPVSLLMIPILAFGLCGVAASCVFSWAASRLFTGSDLFSALLITLARFARNKLPWMIEYYPSLTTVIVWYCLLLGATLLLNQNSARNPA